jgi:Helix-turn-helix domain
MALSNRNLTQNQFLVTHLRGTGRELTVAEARARYGIHNLRARVSELRAAGVRVATRKTPHGTAAYRIPVRLQDGSRPRNVKI